MEFPLEPKKQNQSGIPEFGRTWPFDDCLNVGNIFFVENHFDSLEGMTDKLT